MLGFGSCAAAVAMLLVLGVESVRHGHHGDAFALRDVAETEALLESRADKLERSAGDVSLRSAASAPSLVFYDSDTDETTTLNPEAHVAPGPVESWGEGVDGRLSDEQGWQRTSGTDSVGTDRQRASIERYARFADNRIKVLETKTTGDDVTPGSDYWLRLRLDQQISLYMLSAQEDGIDVESVVYDVVKKPTIKPYKATPEESRKYTKEGKLYANMRENPETPAEWRDRLTADIEARPDYYFARREIPRLPSDLDTFRRELWQQAASIRESRNSGRWFRNTGACISPYRCDYLDVCHNEIDVNEPPSGFVRVVDIHPELKEHE